MSRGDRVRVTAGPHRGQDGTVIVAFRSGVEIMLDEAGWTYQSRYDLESIVTV